MASVIIFIIGVVIGCVISVVIFGAKLVGSLRVDISDPNDDPYLFLVLSKDVSTIYRTRHIILRVDPKNIISHK